MLVFSRNGNLYDFQDGDTMHFSGNTFLPELTVPIFNGNPDDHIYNANAASGYLEENPNQWECLDQFGNPVDRRIPV